MTTSYSASEQAFPLSSRQHWDAIYQNAAIEKLGWHEETPQPSLGLIHECQLPKNACILNAGAGTTTLLDALLAEGYGNLVATDISEVALEKLRERTGAAAAGNVRWITDDLTCASKLPSLEPLDLWHDRAVLHFFTKEKEQRAYFDLVKKLARPGGFVIIAAFNLQGAKTCSGLPVKNYDAGMIAEKLGGDFSLLKSFDYMYEMPSGGVRPYIYTLFKRN
jgi:SAM-dependent methyltransferase